LLLASKECHFNVPPFLLQNSFSDGKDVVWIHSRIQSYALTERTASSLSTKLSLTFSMGTGSSIREQKKKRDKEKVRVPVKVKVHRLF
jgi:hypothetical protein